MELFNNSVSVQAKKALRSIAMPIYFQSSVLLEIITRPSGTWLNRNEEWCPMPTLLALAPGQLPSSGEGGVVSVASPWCAAC